MSTRILSFGGGVDSSAILLHHIKVESLDIDHVVFADTGAEFEATYTNVNYFKSLCVELGLPFHIVRHGKETITEWCLRLGIIPLMAGGSHICSKKFKGDVIQAWAANQGIDNPTYLIGIEANEGSRIKRFTKPKGDNASYEYPLIEMGMTREDCNNFLLSHGLDVRKSSCMFCPFMSQDEILEALQDSKSAKVIRAIEDTFKRTSSVKHRAWLNAGKPLTKRKHAPRGMWRKDSWREGQRLFATRFQGKPISVEEWAEQIGC